jgi:hypothetical protein
MFGFLYGYGIILHAFAVIHWLRRRPDTFWLWIIIIGGWIGAAVYLVAEGLPDLALLGPSFKVFPRRKRIKQLRTEILDNPAPGNYQELGDLLLEQKEYAEARHCFDKAITPRTQDPHSYYGRAQAAIALGDFGAAVAWSASSRRTAATIITAPSASTASRSRAPGNRRRPLQPSRRRPGSRRSPRRN